MDVGGAGGQTPRPPAALGSLRWSGMMGHADTMVVFGDTHLSAADPAKVRAVASFLTGTRATRVVCLGDLFDAWTGSEMLGDPTLAPVLGALRGLVDRGVGVALIHGNRDFLVGAAFTRATGVAVAERRIEVRLADGRRVTIEHGDRFCTADTRYHRMRRALRSRAIRGLCALVPASVRARLATALRRVSRREIAAKPRHALALDRRAIARVVARGRDVVVVGHVHRPERAQVATAGGRTGELCVVGDWSSGGGTYAAIGPGEVGLVVHRVAESTHH